MDIIGGSASSTIAHEVSQILHTHLVKTEIKRFPDGELYLRITENIKDRDIALIQTTSPDENIIELFLLLDAVKRAGAKTRTVVIPYFGYARQDKQFKEGEPISAQALATLISSNATTVITIDPHKEHILDFFTVPAQSISAVPLLSEHLKDKHIDVVLAPDKGALDRAQKASEILHCDVDYLEKTRIDGSTIKITPKSLDVKQKNVAIIDDIISTGGTMAAAIKQLKTQHASKVYVSCTHGLFAGTAIKKLQDAGCDEIIATDTIASLFSTVKTAPIIAKELTTLSR
ncbi:MAG: ribose-phosphate diphosphokinase [Candidatus Thermoplasmatota archaeon]|nr:ribose-phosphate diphosphokinase [Candidatus Thermoplasmatota archaeon]